MERGLSLGEKLKRLRQQRGLTQLDVELELDLANGSLSRIESGVINPTKETLEKFYKLFKLTNWEINYLAGRFANIVTETEVHDAIQTIKPYFDKKGVLAYMVDERSQLWDISTSFSKILDVTRGQVDKLRGSSILSFILDKNYPTYNVFENSDKPELLRNLLARMYVEFKSMEGDPIYNKTLEIIRSDKLASEIWLGYEKSGVDNIFSIQSKNVKFYLKGIPFNLEYAVENLNSNERFRIVEYKPTNKLIKFFLEHF